MHENENFKWLKNFAVEIMIHSFISMFSAEFEPKKCPEYMRPTIFAPTNKKAQKQCMKKDR